MNNFIGKIVCFVIAVGLLFTGGMIVLNFGVDSGAIKTKVTEATVLQIVPEMNCTSGNCSTEYNVTFKNNTNNEMLYATYYTGWFLPVVGQVMTVKYTTFFPMKNVVISAK